MGRYAYGFGFHPNVRIYYAKSLNDVYNITEDKIILVGFTDNPNRVFPNKKVYMVYCSSLGQADLSDSNFYSPEIGYLDYIRRMKQDGILADIITSSRHLASRMGFIYLPPYRRNFKGVFNKDRYGYGFPGNNSRKHRNVVNTISAISMIDPKEIIYVKDADSYSGYSTLFDCNIKSQTTTSDDQYIDVISKHKLAFQFDWGASFGYIALEYGLCGVPCLVSPVYDWYPLEFCKVDNVENWQEIVYRAEVILSNPSYFDKCEDLMFSCQLINENNSGLLYEGLDKLL
jgi:hypothetical protein